MTDNDLTDKPHPIYNFEDDKPHPIYNFDDDKPHLIYNWDETGITTEHRPTRILSSLKATAQATPHYINSMW